jgi:HPt (histidine-containing phosphotransfer) domain-containing protein
VQDEDWELATRLAHTLKGVAGNIGAEQLQEVCGTLEAQAKQQQVEVADIELMQQELQRVLTSLGSLVKTSTQGADVVMDTSLINTVLEGLAQQLADFDTGAQDTIDNYHNQLSVGDLKPLLKSLETALAHYDFDAAQSVLMRMQQAVTKEVAVDKQKLADVISRLAALIADYDTGAQELIEAEESLLIAAGLAAEVKQLSKALEDYDFDAAAEQLTQISLNIIGNKL